MVLAGSNVVCVCNYFNHVLQPTANRFNISSHSLGFKEDLHPVLLVSKAKVIDRDNWAFVFNCQRSLFSDL